MQGRVYEECRYTFHGRLDAFGAVDLRKRWESGGVEKFNAAAPVLLPTSRQKD